MGDDLQITLPTLRVLRVLFDDLEGEHYGLHLSRATGLKSGTLYPILARLERHGLVCSEWEMIDTKAAGRPARRLYRLTGLGIRRTEQELRQLQELHSSPRLAGVR